jgi:hypothetical protein
MTMEDQNFDVFQGSDVTINFTIYDTDGYTAKNISGWALEATFAHPISKAIDSDRTETTDSGITITSGSDGEGTIVLSDDDTDEMTAGDWEWALWRTDDGFEQPLILGTLTIRETARSRSTT